MTQTDLLLRKNFIFHTQCQYVDVSWHKYKHDWVQDAGPDPTEGLYNYVLSYYLY